MKWLLALAALAGCASVVPQTVARMQALDPLRADPAGIALAVTLPPGLGLGPEGATMTLDLVTEAGAERLVLPLQRQAGVAIPGETDPALAFALAPAEAARLRALQERARAAEGGTLRLGLGIAGCAVGTGPAPDARAAAWIRLAADEPFRPLLRRAPLAGLIGEPALAALRPCPPDLPSRR